MYNYQTVFKRKATYRLECKISKPFIEIVNFTLTLNGSRLNINIMMTFEKSSLL